MSTDDVEAVTAKDAWCVCVCVYVCVCVCAIGAMQ